MVDERVRRAQTRAFGESVAIEYESNHLATGIIREEGRYRRKYLRIFNSKPDCAGWTRTPRYIRVRMPQFIRLCRLYSR